eukprot:6213215-Pleurochrysis_carterae.AAC.5
MVEAKVRVAKLADDATELGRCVPTCLPTHLPIYLASRLRSAESPLCPPASIFAPRSSSSSLPQSWSHATGCWYACRCHATSDPSEQHILPTSMHGCLFYTICSCMLIASL